MLEFTRMEALLLIVCLAPLWIRRDGRSQSARRQRMCRPGARLHPRADRSRDSLRRLLGQAVSEVRSDDPARGHGVPEVSAECSR